MNSNGSHKGYFYGVPITKGFSIVGIGLLFTLCFSYLGCSLIEKVLNREMVEERELLGYIYENKYNSKVAKFQKTVNAIGYSPGHIDGKMGSVTRSAIKAFQKDYGLMVSGYVTRKTQAELNKAYEEEFLSFENINTQKIQSALKNAGFDPGPIDGKNGFKTIKAIVEFQKSNGLIHDGKIGLESWKKLKEYLSLDSP